MMSMKQHGTDNPSNTTLVTLVLRLEIKFFKLDAQLHPTLWLFKTAAIGDYHSFLAFYKITFILRNRMMNDRILHNVASFPFTTLVSF